MSDEKQETVADIVAEIRSYAQRCREENFGVPPESERHYNEDDVEYLADRIEAAAKRGRLLSKPPENDNSAPVVSTGENKPGNAAAMREALEYASRVLAKWQQDAPFSAWSEYGEAIDRCRAALAAPPRNCDVGTAEEQRERFNVYCDQRICIHCELPMNGCRFVWAQMPYEKGGDK